MSKNFVCQGIGASDCTIKYLKIELSDRLFFAYFKNASLFMLPHENEAGRKAQLSTATY
ncbi:hypothetical protein [Pseudanabaena sp. CCNP1317]|uniref:hypothetical protein n=1 Tax=Pseudanabaena sp. CCNP1317 TaxID=3110253 RepID=UPI002B20948A|nr:hypothetical protein [Pseudanabaena sp. CCNP1317]